MLCGGRLTVGIGVGGRQEDYHAVGADSAMQTMQGLAQRVGVMKQVWKLLPRPVFTLRQLRLSPHRQRGAL